MCVVCVCGCVCVMTMMMMMPACRKGSRPVVLPSSDEWLGVLGMGIGVAVALS